MQKPTACEPANQRRATRTHSTNGTPRAPPGPQPADLDKRESAAPKTDPRPNPGATALFHSMPVKPQMGGWRAICGQPETYPQIAPAPLRATALRAIGAFALFLV